MTPRRLLLLLGALTAIRLALAALVPLTPDEAYYWLWSRHLRFGYYDDAPLIAWWIRAGTIIAGDQSIGIRLLSPIGAALGSVLLWRAGEDLFPERQAGLVAAVLLNATLMLNVGAVITTPDTPLLLCWTAALAAAARWQAGGDDRWWLATGLAAGLAFEAKYTGALVFVVLGLWLLATPKGRAALLRPWPWVGLVLGVAMTLPVVWWNAAHGWVSFAKQGGRSAHADLAGLPVHLAGLVFGQIGLATPIVAGLMGWGLWRLLRDRSAAALLVVLSVLIPGAVFAEHTISGAVQPNWPAILYPGAALAAGALGVGPVRGRIGRPWFAAAVALGGALSLVVWLQAVVAPIGIAARRDPTAIQLAGWRNLSGQVARIASRSGIGVVASTDYSTVGQLAHGLPQVLAVAGVGPRWRWFDLPGGASGAVLLVEPHHLADFVRHRFTGLVRIGGAIRRRGGNAVEYYDIFRFHPTPGIPVVIMRKAR